MRKRCNYCIMADVSGPAYCDWYRGYGYDIGVHRFARSTVDTHLRRVGLGARYSSNETDQQKHVIVYGNVEVK